MAEFIAKSIISGRHNIKIASAATSDEEYGNPIYPPAKKKLREKGIDFDNGKTARQMTIDDYNMYDMIIAMEKYNVRNILRIIGSDPEGKISLLMDYTSNPREIADPWYTGDFERTFLDIKEGCEGLVKYLCENERL